MEVGVGVGEAVRVVARVVEAPASASTAAVGVAWVVARLATANSKSWRTGGNLCAPSPPNALAPPMPSPSRRGGDSDDGAPSGANAVPPLAALAPRLRLPRTLSITPRTMAACCVSYANSSCSCGAKRSGRAGLRCSSRGVDTLAGVMKRPIVVSKARVDMEATLLTAALVGRLGLPRAPGVVTAPTAA